MATTATTTSSRQQRLLTIGTVCGMLKEEFPDISISQIGKYRLIFLAR